MLFGAQANDHQCSVPDFFSLTGIRILAALPAQLDVEYRTSDEWSPCFQIPVPLRYFPPGDQTHISLQAVISGGSAKIFALERLVVHEPVHPLDLDATLLVSHELVEEIFDKVAHFGERLNKGEKGGLSELGRAVANLKGEAARLEVYTADLVRGTVQFQASLLASLSMHKTFSLEDVPLMKQIRAVVSRLEDLQGRIYRRLQDVKSSSRARKVLREADDGLQKATKHLEDLQALAGDPRFRNLASESAELIDVLGKLDVDALISQLHQLEGHASQTHVRAGIFVALSAGILVLIFAFLLMRRIQVAEKNLSL